VVGQATRAAAQQFPPTLSAVPDIASSPARWAGASSCFGRRDDHDASLRRGTRHFNIGSGRSRAQRRAALAAAHDAAAADLAKRTTELAHPVDCATVSSRVSAALIRPSDARRRDGAGSASPGVRTPRWLSRPPAPSVGISSRRCASASISALLADRPTYSSPRRLVYGSARPLSAGDD